MTHPNEGVLPRTRERTLVTMVRQADPDYTKDNEYVIEYEFNGKRRIFKGYYKHRGPYA